MLGVIDKLDIYNKNINILIGAGASADLFPTLGLKIKDDDASSVTIETLATKFAENEEMKAALFMHYYQTCIYPVQTFHPEKISCDAKLQNIKEYKIFLKTLLGMLDRRKELNRKINIFTTNYDGCLIHGADSLLSESGYDFVVNDGTSGFHRKILHAKNFNTFQCQTGIFEQVHYGVPQLNVINLHGSVYWKKSGDKIEVKYKSDAEDLLNDGLRAKLKEFSAFLGEEKERVSAIPSVSLNQGEIEDFWGKYNNLPIVNPTKWKFHETVFEEHYYQMLRFMSYELEKPNSILVTFGFSFADEHILKLVQRSLSNKELQTYICCFSQEDARKMEGEFKQWRNVKVISPPDGKTINFSNFNKYVFSLNPERWEVEGGGE